MNMTSIINKRFVKKMAKINYFFGSRVRKFVFLSKLTNVFLKSRVSLLADWLGKVGDINDSYLA